MGMTTCLKEVIYRDDTAYTVVLIAFLSWVLWSVYFDREWKITVADQIIDHACSRHSSAFSTNQWTNFLPQFISFRKVHFLKETVVSHRWRSERGECGIQERDKLQNFRFEHQPFVFHSGKGLMPKAIRLHNHSSYTRNLTLSTTKKFRNNKP